MSGRALVTGANGFVGRKLTAHLQAAGWEVFPCDFAGDCSRCDVTSPEQVAQVLHEAMPLTHVFHLAAQTFVPRALEDPVGTLQVNLNGTIHLLNAVQALDADVRVLYIGSSDAYGPPQYLPIDEEHPLRPQNPYAISKAAADHFCAYQFAANKMPVIRMRPFNHSGPGQAPDFVLPSFARQVAEIEAGRHEPRLMTGDLSAMRDFTHVDDVIRAYEAAALHGKPGEAYNVCSDRAVEVGAALQTLLERAECEIETGVDPARVRPVDVPEVRGSHAKLTEHTGWHPRIRFEAMIEELLAYWREQVAARR